MAAGREVGGKGNKRRQFRSSLTRANVMMPWEANNRSIARMMLRRVKTQMSL